MIRPTEIERNLLSGIDSKGRTNHDDPFLKPYCSDDSTLTKPDTFNLCHDMGWLKTSHDSDTSDSWVEITKLGREVLHGPPIRVRLEDLDPRKESAAQSAAEGSNQNGTYRR